MSQGDPAALQVQATEEVAAARHERYERLRRGSVWFLAVMLLALLLGLMIGRVVNGQIPWGGVMPEPPAGTPPAPLPRVLEVLPQQDERGLTLQLLLERSLPYRRTEESGAVSLLLPGLQLVGGTQSGRVQQGGHSLSWRVEARGQDVQVLLVGLAGALQVRDRLEPAGDRWLLWIEVPFAGAPAEEPLALDQLPPARAAESQSLPAWAVAPVPAADAPVALEKAGVPPPEPQPDGLSRARQALGAGDSDVAIRELETSQKSRGRDPEVLRWLARAYLADGQQQRLLVWLPAQLAQMPRDSELRLLLARARLQAGDIRGAIATLEQHAPALAQAPTYHALLAASYQQAGQWRESAELYRRMVALRPSQSTWQLGLARALERLGQPAEALQHYHMALRGLGLDEGARRLAGARVAALEGH